MLLSILGTGGPVVAVMRAVEIADGVIKAFRVYDAVKKTIQAAVSIFEMIAADRPDHAPTTKVERAVDELRRPGRAGDDVMRAPRSVPERLRALTAELRSSVAQVRRAGQDARAAMRADRQQTDVTATAEFQRLEREAQSRSAQDGPGRRRSTLQERVDRGELTWRQIREGTADPAATRLYLDNQSAFLDEIGPSEAGGRGG